MSPFKMGSFGNFVVHPAIPAAPTVLPNPQCVLQTCRPRAFPDAPEPGSVAATSPALRNEADSLVRDLFDSSISRAPRSNRAVARPVLRPPLGVRCWML